MPKAIILAGGVGSRLWPLSREAYPKQFISLFNNKSLFQKTVERLEPIFGFENLIFSTGARYKFIVKNQLDELGIDAEKEQIVVEPKAKSTLPAVLLCMSRFGKDTYGVFPSDHEMSGGLGESINNASKISSENIVSFGIVPNKPHTGYGYIKPGSKIGEGFKVESFVEKPDLSTAKHYVSQGYFWNAGMLYTRAKMFVGEVEKFAPEYLAVYEEGETAYEKIKGVSMEYAVLEKTDKAAVIPIKSHWNDLGSFSSFFEVYGGGNIVTNTEVLDLDSKNSLVMSDGNKLVGLVGVKDLIVVDTRDALLVGSRKNAQGVRDVFKFLNKCGDRRAKYHNTIYRPWGFFTFIENCNKYRVKKVVVSPGKRMTQHLHNNRTEHWVVTKGTALIRVGEKEFSVKAGESVYVPQGVAHLVKNTGKIPLEIVEVQVGESLSEKDLERINDDTVEDL